MALTRYSVDLPKTVAVVGLNGAIGSAISLALAERGVAVHGFDIAEPAVETAPERDLHTNIPTQEGRAHYKHTGPVTDTGSRTLTILDVDDPDRCVEGFEAQIKDLAPEGLVIASGLYPARLLADENPSGLLRLLEVNSVVPALLVRSFLEHTSHASASVVVTSSLAAARARVGTAAYSTSKVALERLVAALVVESRDTGARINVVRPGYVSTSSGLNPIPADYDARMKARGVSSSPEDLVDTYLWLLSTGSRQVNGMSIDVDRGMHLGSLEDRAWLES